MDSYSTVLICRICLWQSRSGNSGPSVQPSNTVAVINYIILLLLLATFPSSSNYTFQLYAHLNMESHINYY